MPDLNTTYDHVALSLPHSVMQALRAPPNSRQDFWRCIDYYPYVIVRHNVLPLKHTQMWQDSFPFIKACVVHDARDLHTDDSMGAHHELGPLGPLRPQVEVFGTLVLKEHTRDVTLRRILEMSTEVTFACIIRSLRTFYHRRYTGLGDRQLFARCST